MTYATLIFSILISALPLTAVARDVKGLNRAKLCAEGHKVGCPDGGNRSGAGQHKDDPAKAQVEYGDSIDYSSKDLRKAQERRQEIDSVGEDEL